MRAIFWLIPFATAITKSGLIVSLMKHEIGYLRDQWEHLILEGRKEQNGKVKAVKELNLMAEAAESTGSFQARLDRGP